MECLCLCAFSEQSVSIGKLYLTDRRIVFYRFRDASKQSILWEDIQDVIDSWGVHLSMRDSKTCRIYTLKHYSTFKEITKVKNELKESSWWRFLPI
jgi:hypothetical protein